MDMSSSTIRVVRNEILEEYEPMTSLYWKKKKKPNIDLRVSPFAVDRQLEDQKWSMLNNRVSVSILIYTCFYFRLQCPSHTYYIF